MASIKRLDLGNLNPIYERGLNKPDVHQIAEHQRLNRDAQRAKRICAGS